MIINHNLYPCVYHNRVEYKNYCSIQRLSKFSDFDYWYIAIFYTQGHIELINFKDIIPDEILKKVFSDEKTHLLISCPYESNIEHIERIYDELICKLNLPPNKIVVHSDNADIGIEIKRIADLYKQPIIKHIYGSISEAIISFQLRSQIRLISKVPTLEKKIYSKSFLNFNRKWRLHRPTFVGLLHINNLLNHGHVSLGVTKNGMNWESFFNSAHNIKDEYLRNLLMSNKESISSIPNLYLDTTNLIVDRSNLIESDIGLIQTSKYYTDTYFSIVSETHFFDSPGRFLTEKTFKPIAFKHPILMVSSPYTLELLQTMGYKTFHPYINESYDSIENDAQRLIAILEEVSRLVNLSDVEVLEFIDNVKPIVEHNYNVLLGK